MLLCQLFFEVFIDLSGLFFWVASQIVSRKHLFLMGIGVKPIYINGISLWESVSL